jgi:Holliday junction DNA helicase RuvB
MQVGFLDRTQQGRKATEATYAYLGIKQAQGGLFEGQ